MTTRVDSPAAVGVVGGGTMGVGIAHAFAAAGETVVLVEADPSRAEAAFAAVETTLRRAAALGHSENTDGAVSRVSATADRGELAGVSLVVEAVPEDRSLKCQILGAIEQVIDDSTVLASNTSSISIAFLAGALTRPDRFLGMHFFNPVPASRLIELVHGPQTSRATIDAAQGWAQQIGKQAIEVADSPGFASSRLGVAIGLEAIRMLEGGVASAADIDDAMVLGYRFPMGPLRLTDLVGLDVRLGIAEYLHETLGERFAPPRLLRDKVELGELGKKCGRGFFDWPAS